MPWEELGKSKVSIDQSNPGISNAVTLTGSILAKDITSGENVELSSIADTDGKNVLRTVDAAPFAYDTVSLAKRVTQAKKDIVAKATDDIINTIKLENIKMFLRMDEVSGATAYDLINRDIQFDIMGNPLLAQDGPFGNCIYFDGADDYLIQKPITKNPQSVGLLWGVLDTANTKIATRMNAISTVPGIVRLRLKRVGTLDSATLKVSIYEDSADAPGTLVASATSETLACTEVGTTSETRGFVFNDTTIRMPKDKKYWLVLEYDDSTGVDASNYVAWAYKNDNTYGERRAVYDSTESAWVVTDAENHVFDLYNNDLKLADDFSLIAVVKDANTAVSARSIMGVASMTSNVNYLLQKYNNSYYRFCCIDTAARNANIYRQFNEFVIFAATFNKEASTGKINFYANGKLEATTNGTAETANGQIAQPINIGSASWESGTVTGYTNWKGYIGPVIMTSSTLTAAQVAEVTKSLICMRNAGVGV